MTDTEQIIELDRKTKAVHSGSAWAVQKLQPDGNWDMVAHFTGGPRALAQWCERNGVYPTRDAEARLAAIPEAAFRQRS